MSSEMTHDPHPFHIVGECQDCCDESEALRLGYPDSVYMGDCETPGCVNASPPVGVGTHMTSSDDGRVAASAVPLAVVKSQGMFDKLNERERAVVVAAALGQSEAVLSAADRYDRINGIVRICPSDPATVEAAAEAIYNAAWEDSMPDSSQTWGRLPDDEREPSREIARIVLAAIATPTDETEK